MLLLFSPFLSRYFRFTLFAFALLVVGCKSLNTTQGVLTVAGRAIINNSGNKSMRFDLLRWGIDQFCQELTQTGTPLRLANQQPIIGRYYAEKCSASILERGDTERVLARFSGEGFAWTVATGRIGFSAPALLELAPDFRVYGDSLYVYFRPMVVDTSGLKLLMAEHQSLLVAADLAGIDEEKVGSRIIQAQLSRGFTVLFHDDGHLDFSLGLLELGQKPFHPYKVRSSPRRTIANARTEVPAGGRDYIGRLRLEATESLQIRLRVEGTEAIDVALLPVADGLASLQSYLENPGPLRQPNRLAYYSQVGKSAPMKQEIKLTSGEYFLLLDHSKSFGDASPEPPGLAARVDYLIQVGKSSSRN